LSHFVHSSEGPFFGETGKGNFKREANLRLIKMKEKDGSFVAKQEQTKKMFLLNFKLLQVNYQIAE
jgi:hypothetical protein